MDTNRPGEFELIKRFLAAAPCTGPQLLVPAGDDCAVLGSDTDPILVTTDLLVEDIHFTMDSILPYELGTKAMAVNLSDMAAMGGVPKYAFLSVAFKRYEKLDVMDGIMEGIRDMCRRFGVLLAGGDTTATPDPCVINICLIGSAPGGRYIKRAGALPGDLIQISGPLGGSAACLHLLLTGQDPRRYPSLAKAHFSPEPRVQIGQMLGRIPGVHSMIDLSDGLIQDLGHICELSGTGAQICSDDIPLFEDAFSAAQNDRNRVLNWALSGGEDYELCWTVAPEAGKRVSDTIGQSHSISPVTIGVITDQSGVTVMRNGKLWTPAQGGWDHFRVESVRDAPHENHSIEEGHRNIRSDSEMQKKGPVPKRHA